MLAPGISATGWVRPTLTNDKLVNAFNPPSVIRLDNMGGRRPLLKFVARVVPAKHVETVLDAISIPDLQVHEVRGLPLELSPQDTQLMDAETADEFYLQVDSSHLVAVKDDKAEDQTSMRKLPVTQMEQSVGSPSRQNALKMQKKCL
eukprot:9742934-Ditylum_brightwellii.AAC.2